MLSTGFIIIISHVLLYYVWYVVNLNGGELIPADGDWCGAWDKLVAATTPSADAARLYFCFLAVQFLFAFVIPGIDIKGRADENGTVLTYRCNGLLSWWVSLSLLALVTVAQLNEESHGRGSGGGIAMLRVFSLGQWAELSGPIMTVSVLWANALSVFLIVNAYATKSECARDIKLNSGGKFPWYCTRSDSPHERQSCLRFLHGRSPAPSNRSI